MPTIEISLEDLENLIGEKLDEKKLEELVFYIKGEIEEIEGDKLILELKDTNRPELWSVEGISIFLRRILGKDKGIPQIKLKKSNLKVFVEEVKARPYIACGIVRNVDIGDETLRQLMQFQEKIHQTFGRNRKKVAIGIHELDKIKFPIYYREELPDEIQFVPLNENKVMNGWEILETEKGKKYGDLIKSFEKWPVIRDSENKVLSFPPIINSEITGHVKPGKKDLFIDVTGTDFEAVNQALSILLLILQERGGKPETCEVIYKDKKLHTPQINIVELKVDWNQILKWIGLNLDKNQIKELLEKMGYEVKGEKVRFPSWRRDILGWVDIAEDLAIAYNYNNIEPEEPKVYFKGGLSKIEEFSDKIRNICVGLGGQEIMTFILTNPEIFEKAGLTWEREVENPMSKNYSILRNTLIPSFLDFLSKNTKARYPQILFEDGEVIGKKTERRLIFGIASQDSSFSKIKSYLEALMKELGKEFKLREIRENPFIEGRVGEIIIGKKRVGVIGEIHPKFLENFGIKMPVALFEIVEDELL